MRRTKQGFGQTQRIAQHRGHEVSANWAIITAFPKWCVSMQRVNTFKGGDWIAFYAWEDIDECEGHKKQLSDSALFGRVIYLLPERGSGALKVVWEDDLVLDVGIHEGLLLHAREEDVPKERRKAIEAWWSDFDDVREE